MEPHPDLEAEQAHVDRAYERLDQLRAKTREMLSSVLTQSRGGTPQFREERDVLVRTSLARLEQLDVGDQALCFGRIDRTVDDAGAGYQGQRAGSGSSSANGQSPQAGRDGESAADGATTTGTASRGPSGGRIETFHVGRLGISSEEHEPLVVDWRAPVAEPFYRATGRDPMGLVLRRHLAASRRRITGIEDERFGEPAGPDAAPHDGSITGPTEPEIGGPGALLAALGAARSGRMRDIVATIQREQDEIIRAPLPGVLVVQGGPGTGKTAVALHRAAYLLYTHRFPLERQGVLVIGPNPLFLRYIEHVLPSLGESGVTLSTISGLVHGVGARASEPPEASRLKGDVRMAKLLSNAVRTRQRALRDDAEVPFGSAVLRLRADESAQIVSAAKRRPGTHNSRRRFVEQMVIRKLADDYLRSVELHRSLAGPPETTEEEEEGTTFDIGDFGAQLRRVPQFAEALDRMWPRLSAEELVHDLFGSKALLSLAAKGLLDQSQQLLLFRPRSMSVDEIPWTPSDLALIDEARVILGARRGRASSNDQEEGPRTYGHIVVDEAQDLSPMQLRMVTRRSLSGSVSAVGDIAQATGAWAPGSWDEITAHLPHNRPARTVNLTVSYRTPSEVVEVAAPVLKEAAPALEPPTAVRSTGAAPVFRATSRDDLAALAASTARELVDEMSPGTTAVLCSGSLVAELAAALDSNGVQSADPRSDGLGAPLSLLPVDLASGLEFDAVVVVEPAAIVEESAQGLRVLYMALTRPTRRLAVVSARPLPPSMRG